MYNKHLCPDQGRVWRVGDESAATNLLVEGPEVDIAGNLNC